MTELSGWLGAFEVEWRAGKPDRPRGVHALQRLHPRLPGGRDRLQLPGRSRQVQGAPRLRQGLRRDRRDRFLEKRDAARRNAFDLVLDLSREPLIRAARSCRRATSRRATIRSSRRSPRRSSPALVGEFEKPQLLPVHANDLRAQPLRQAGLQRCASTSARAARSSADGDHVKVEPHLCAGCGGCATVCPSGAMTYAYPKVPDIGVRLKTAARRPTATPAARTPASCSTTRPTAALSLLAYGRKGKGLPARVIPLEVLPRRLDRHRPAARRDRLRREPGQRACRPRRPPRAMSRR